MLELSNFRELIMAGNLDQVKKISSISLESRDEIGQTPLIIASQHGSLNIVEFFLSLGANVNAEDYDGWTSLHHAAKENFLDVVVLLIQKGATVNCSDCGGFTPLMWACYKNRTEIAQLLVSAGADLNAKNENGICCLSWAAGRNHTEIVRLLANAGALVNSFDRNNTTPLIWAARKGCLDGIKILCAHGALTDVVGMRGWTALLAACRNGHTETALYLIPYTNSLNVVDTDGNTALHYAAKNGYAAVVEALLQKGASTHLVNKNNETALRTAVKATNVECVKAILKFCHEPETSSKNEKTALWWAVDRSNFEIFKAILDSMHDSEKNSENLDRVLLLAVERRKPAFVYELLNKGAKASETDKDGNNVFHIAVKGSSREIVDILLSDPKNSKFLYKPNKRGETPFKMDMSNGKNILRPIYRSGSLNIVSDSIMGFETYSSALAELICDPTLSTPLNIGLMAPGDSAKSFLRHLKDEVKEYSMFSKDIPRIDLTVFLFTFVVLLISALPFFVCSNVLISGSVFLSIYALQIFTIGAVILYRNYFDSQTIETLYTSILRVQAEIKLLFCVLFCNLNQSDTRMIAAPKNLKFVFSNISTLHPDRCIDSLPSSVASASLHLEKEFGKIKCRLLTALYTKEKNSGRFRTCYCIPSFIVFMLFWVLVECTIILLVKVYILKDMKPSAILNTYFALAAFIIIVMIISRATILRKILYSMINPVHKTCQAAKGDITFFLKRKASEISYLAQHFDFYGDTRTRLIFIFELVDLWERSEVLKFIDAMKIVFDQDGFPCVVVLATDPLAVLNGRNNHLNPTLLPQALLSSCEHFRRLVQLPIFLKMDIAKANIHKIRNRLVSVSSISTEQSSLQKKTGKKKRYFFIQMTSVHNLVVQFAKYHDAFETCPSMLYRLLSIAAMASRLLRSYQISFIWQNLASWIYLTDFWPVRASWIICYVQKMHDTLDDDMRLRDLSEAAFAEFPSCCRNLFSLERSFHSFNSFISAEDCNLTVFHVKDFSSASCHLDPNLQCILKEMSDSSNFVPDNCSTGNSEPKELAFSVTSLPNMVGDPDIGTGVPRRRRVCRLDNDVSSFTSTVHENTGRFESEISPKPESDITTRLSLLTVEEVCSALQSIPQINKKRVRDYMNMIEKHNITGAVLYICPIEKLKEVLRMNFGDWILFEDWIKTERMLEQYLYSSSHTIREISESGEDKLTVVVDPVAQMEESCMTNAV